MSDPLNEQQYQWNQCKHCDKMFQTAFDEHWDECFECMDNVSQGKQCAVRLHALYYDS